MSIFFILRFKMLQIHADCLSLDVRQADHLKLFERWVHEDLVGNKINTAYSSKSSSYWIQKLIWWYYFYHINLSGKIQFLLTNDNKLYTNQTGKSFQNIWLNEPISFSNTASSFPTILRRANLRTLWRCLDTLQTIFLPTCFQWSLRTHSLWAVKGFLFSVRSMYLQFSHDFMRLVSEFFICLRLGSSRKGFFSDHSVHLGFCLWALNIKLWDSLLPVTLQKDHTCFNRSISNLTKICYTLFLLQVKVLDRVHDPRWPTQVNFCCWFSLWDFQHVDPRERILRDESFWQLFERKVFQSLWGWYFFSSFLRFNQCGIHW